MLFFRIPAENLGPFGWLLAAFAFLSPVPVSSEPIRLRSQITQVQPMTGIVLWSDNPKAKMQADAIALEFRYCGYDEVVDANGRYDFSRIDQVLDDIASRNHQAVLRFHFCYVGKETTVPDFIRSRSDYRETVGKSEKKTTHFCDWSNQALQEFTLQFYSRFAQRYDSDPRIAFLQTGFGLWAEYHIYSGPRKLGKTFPSKAFQDQFLRHMSTSFQDLPWSISIDAADSTYSPLEDNAELLALSFGVFDDSFLCKPHARENAVNWRILGPERWRHSPAGGEFSYYTRMDQKLALADQGPHGVSFEQAAEQFHISYMIGNDQLRFQPAERLRDAASSTGYRFRVTEATLAEGRLRLRVANEGVAPIYRDAYFGAGGNMATRSLRGLLPGQTLECEINGVTTADIETLSIRSDAILPTQVIQFAADL